MHAAISTCLRVAAAAWLWPAAALAQVVDMAQLAGGGRATALGGAYVALADEPLGGSWNPAGLASLRAGGSAFSQSWLQPGWTLTSTGLALRPRQTRLVLGARAQLLERAARPGGDALSADLGDPGALGWAGTLEAALQAADWLRLGAGFVRYSGAPGEPLGAGGWSASLGLGGRLASVRWGAALRGVQLWARVPSRAALRHPGLALGIAPDFGGGRLVLPLQIQHATGQPDMGAAGLEWRTTAAFCLRTGFGGAFGEPASHPLFGLGFGLQGERLCLDYALRAGIGRAPEQTLGLALGFGAAEEERGLAGRARPKPRLAARAETPAPAARVVPAVAAVPVAPVPAAAPVATPPIARVAPAAEAVPRPAAPAPPAQPRATGREDAAPAAPRAAVARANGSEAPIPARAISAATAAGGRFVVRAGIFADMDAAALEIARLYRGDLHPSLEHHGSLYVVVVQRCSTRAEAEALQARVRAAGAHCSIDEE